MNKKTKKKTKKKTLEELFHEVLILDLEIKHFRVIFEERDKLLEEIFKRTKKAKKVNFNDEEILVEVAEQNGHYVFHRPLRLSIKKAS
jgi:phosphopantetheine adenylyltransferase